MQTHRTDVLLDSGFQCWLRLDIQISSLVLVFSAAELRVRGKEVIGQSGHLSSANETMLIVNELTYLVGLLSQKIARQYRWVECHPVVSNQPRGRRR